MLRQILLLCQISALCGISVNDFYPFGSTHGDTTLFRNDDSTSEAIPLTGGFPFFGQTRNYLWLATNGILSTDQPITQYTPAAFPLSQAYQMIAPFWADVDTRCVGDVTYRGTTEAPVLQRVSREVGSYFPTYAGFRANYAFVATWYNTAAYAASDCAQSYPERDTFQCVLATDGRNSFAIFLYDQIDWILGTASGGVGAEVGFNSGDGVNYFKVAGSLTSDIMNIRTSSNVGISGVWAFQINQAEIVTAKPPPTRPPHKVTHWRCNNDGLPSCKCTHGWTGEQCKIPIDYCTAPPEILKDDQVIAVPFCGLNGYCNYTTSQGSKCICDEGYYGDFCQHMNKTKRVSDRCLMERTKYTMQHADNKTLVETTYQCNQTELCIPDDMNCYQSYPPRYNNGHPVCNSGRELNTATNKCDCKYAIGWCVPAEAGGYLVQSFFKAQIETQKSCLRDNPLAFKLAAKNENREIFEYANGNSDKFLMELHNRIKNNAARYVDGNSDQSLTTAQAERGSTGAPEVAQTTGVPQVQTTRFHPRSTGAPKAATTALRPESTGAPEFNTTPFIWVDTTEHSDGHTNVFSTTTAAGTSEFSCDNYGTPYCSCAPGWTGDQCDGPIDYCTQRPQVMQNGSMIEVPFCGQNGHCHYDTTDGSRCDCDKGYYGDFCQHMRKSKYVADRCIMRKTQYTNQNEHRIETVYECDATSEICIPDDMDCYRNMPVIRDDDGHLSCVAGREYDSVTQRCICKYPVGWCIPSHVANTVLRNYFKNGRSTVSSSA